MKYQFIETPSTKWDQTDYLIDLPTKNTRFKGVTENLRKGLERLKAPIDEEEIPVLFHSQLELAHFYTYLAHMHQYGLLKYSAIEKGRVIATLKPQSTPFSFSSQLVEAPFSLSRFSLMRREGVQLILESAVSGSILTLSKEALSLIFALTKPKNFEELKMETDLSDEGVKETLLLLQNGKMLSKEEGKAAALWELHDLYFHQCSRSAFQVADGATFRFEGIYPPLPALKEVVGERIPLYRPETDEIIERKIPFYQVLEERRSIRKNHAPLSERALGEFLFHVARVKGEVKEQGYEFTRRPYPAGGACYELEIYPIIPGKGLYYYHPKEHALIRIEADQKKLTILLQGEKHGIEEPFVYFGITARFGRVSWKYEKMAYAAIMKNVGVLYQTMYLVATAMGLAPCAIGGGSSHTFAQLVGEDFLEESQVGEFILAGLAEG
jgi:SagB-type dehydrogenase family enzyme